MEIRLVVVGSLKRHAERDLCDDYIKRIRRYCRVDEREVKSGKRMLADLRKACKDANVVAMEVKGSTLSSKQLARRFEGLASRGKGIVAVVIGAADGIPSELHRDEEWSLSALTLPHRLARVVVLEQLYRAMTILRGEPYDH
jgi:23S rRNA (pseudouridine1915-N3)-methyltransferase